ncbi:MAG: iron ABC transporter permease [Desulfobacteraceae bacterium]|nr:iron ABC transporter permease [Desulfobacteraceae bacterium]
MLRQASAFLLVLLAGVLLLEIIFATASGYLNIKFWDVARIVFAKLFGINDSIGHLDEVALAAVWEVRLPRVLTAALVGSGLAVSGAVFQAILLNPLADPYTLGISAGAAFGASLALVFNTALIGIWTVPIFAFGGAAATLAAVIYLTASSGDYTSGNLILSGIIVAAILSAGVSLLKFLADEQVSIIIFWLMGSFASKTWGEVVLAATAVIFGVAVCFFFSRDLNLLALGGRAAGSLGVSPRRISLVLLITASLVASVCVSVSGIIGFVGLLIPHIVRFLTGPDNRRLIPVSALLGACLLLFADTVIRTALPNEIPIGVVTALIGGPVFCYIYRKRQAGSLG